MVTTKHTLRIALVTLSIGTVLAVLAGCVHVPADPRDGRTPPGTTTVEATTTVTPATTTRAGTTAETTTTGEPTEPPGIPGPATAREQLAEMRVAPDGSMAGYDRDKFPHWSNQGERCNTREVVLARDGTGVKAGADCYPTSGSWTSPYDGATWTDPSDIDIDHVVPLAEAWRTGAANWTTAERERFANDLDHPQLIAVTDNVNQEKGDKAPEDWQPPRQAYRCTYAEMWIDVKYTWKLTIEPAEKTTLEDLLNRC